MTNGLKRYPIVVGFSLFVLFGFAAIITSCRAEVTATTEPVPTIEDQPLIAVDVPITTLLRYPYDFEGEHVRITGQYRPLPLMACSKDPHTSPATWMLSDGGIEIAAAGFDGVLRELGQTDIPLVVEGRWQYWDGPVGCGRRAPEEELWHLQVSKIISPNPLSQLAAAGEEVASIPISTPSEDAALSIGEETTIGAGTDMLVVGTPTTDSVPPATTTPIPSATPRPTFTAQATIDGQPSDTRTAVPATTATGEATAIPTSNASMTSTATATETPDSSTTTITPSLTPLPTQIAPTGGDTLLFEHIARSELGVADIHAWEFEALDDDTITVSVGPSTPLDVAIELVDPDGTTLEVTNDSSSGQGESIIEINLVKSGVYKVQVRAVGGTSGSYSIVLTNLESEAFLVFKDHLSYGGVGTGNLSTNTDHLWDFDAAAGDMVTIRVDPAIDDDVVLFLVAPDSTELLFIDEGEAGEAEQIMDFVITEAGVYSIRVGELEFQPASYTVTLEGP